MTKRFLLGVVFVVMILLPSSSFAAILGGGPDAPTPISPEYGKFIISIPEASMPDADLFPPVSLPEVKWSEVPGTTNYNIQFSNSIGFSTIVYQQNTANTSYTPHTSNVLSLIPDGVWYWRVRATAPLTTEYSTPMEFTKQWGSPSNGPGLISPSDGATLDFYEYPTFTWNKVMGAASYRLEIDTDTSFAFPLSYSLITLATSHQPTDKLANGFYYWRVVPLDGGSKDGTPSEAREVTMDYSHVPTLLEPLDGSFPTFTPTFKWTAVYGAEYYRLEYSTDPAFPATSATTVVTTRNTTYTPQATIKNDVDIYWRVRAHSGDSVSQWSQVFEFEKHWYLVPTLLTPTNNHQHTRFPVFSWTPVPGAARYYIEVNDSNNFNPPLCQSGEYTSQTTFTINKWVAPCTGTIFWRVTPYDGSGNPGKPSNTFSFVNDLTTLAVDLVYPQYYYMPLDFNVGSPTDPYLNPNVDRSVPYPIFTWQRQTHYPEGGRIGNAYRIQVSQDATFISVDWEYDTETLSAAPSSNSSPFIPQEGVDYFWRVCAVATFGSNDCLPAGVEDHWSQRWITQFDSSKNFQRHSEMPLNYYARTMVRNLWNTPPRLDWFPFLGATSYQVEISTDINFGVSDIVDSATVTIPSYAPAQALAERHLNKTDYGTFYWRVKANNDADWSEIWRFQIASQGEWTQIRASGIPFNRLLIGDDPDDIVDNNFELIDLYGAQDDLYWFFGLTANTSTTDMTYAIYFDLDYKDNSGGSTDPRGYNVTTIASHRPEYVLYVFQIGSAFSSANTALYKWTGSSWGPPDQLNLIGGSLILDGSHLELKIPMTAIGYGQDNGSINLAAMSFPGIGINSNNPPTDVVPDVAGSTASLIDRFTVVSDRPQLVFPFDNLGGDPIQQPFVYPFFYEPPTGYDYGAILATHDELPLFLILENKTIMTESKEDDQTVIPDAGGGVTKTTTWAGFVFEAYTDPEFTSVALHVDSDSTTPYYSYPVHAHEYDLQGDNSYYWRFRIRYLNAINAEYFSPWSEGFRFERKGFVPKNLQNSVDFATPTFTWDMVEGAEKYRIQVDDDPNFGSTAYNIETTQNSYTPITTLGNGTYYWRVQAKRHTVANYGDFSTVQSFELTLPIPVGLVHNPGGVVGEAPTLC
ncbi:MAG: hypothetical protein HC806_08005, partial [Anaerolineae bacterium]|nr:hypothetical protein [Anaerolineae bacterium]